ncbi:biotin-dependent carboxyltransferase family protein [Campylobacter sp. RM12637]|uniref:5-oxoprolinase subunit C family protein n=1 Tax=Campylobacter sp. RM12637 TaxID=2735734 RepID=UPI0030156B1E|nr:biotin-dependent carboxyltransferase family protein [Campylobacter sp. RM12637]
MKITKISSIATIQDLGRFSYKSYGVNESGALDKWSFMLGNALLGNDLNAPAIEVILGGIEIYCNKAMTFCITGANYEAFIDEKPIHNNYRIRIEAGKTLRLIRAMSGMCAYICAYGGFSADFVLNSASTNLSASFGGFNGRALKIGDELSIGSRMNLSQIAVSRIKPRDKIRIIKGAEWELFSDEAKHNLLNQEFNISSSSNRMGYRLNSDFKLNLINELSLPSHGVSAGTIQVPSSGEPIVLLKDAQTTGGYPKIAQVIEADLGLFAQSRINSKISFELVSIEEALMAKKERISHINQIKEYASEN